MPMKIPGSAQFGQFVEIANAKGVSGRTILEGQQGPGGSSVVAKSKWDFIGHIGRSAEAKSMNDDVRATFRSSVLDMFGVSDESGLPDSVRTAMKFEDYGKGKPLTARRIRAVQTAVEQHVASVKQALRDRLTAAGVVIDEQIEKRIDKLMDTCIKDAFNQDTIDLVMANPLGLLFEETGSGGLSLLSKDKVESRTQRVVSNVELMQDAACDAPGLFAAAKPFLWTGYKLSLTKPLAESMVVSVMRLDAKDLDDLKLLAPGASVKDVQQAAAAFDKLVSEAMDRTAPQHVKQDAVTLRHYKLILSSMIFARAFPDGSSLRSAQATLEEDAARKLMRFSRDSAKSYAAIGEETPNIRRTMLYMAKRWKEQAASLEQLKFFVDMGCGGPSGEDRPIVPFEEKVEDVDPEVSSRVTEGFSEEMADEQEACVNGIVKGEGSCSDALRDVFDRKLHEVQAFSSADAVKARCENAVKRTLCHGIARNCAAFAQDKGLDAFTDVLGNVSVNISARSHVRGLGWSHEDEFMAPPADAAAARDQLAAFITGNPRKNFAALDAAQRNKVFIVMSLISQLKQAAFTGPGLALNTSADRAKAESRDKPAFACISDPKTDRCSARITMKDGVLQISFKGHQDVRQLQTRGDDGEISTADVGAGSTHDVEFTFGITEREINRMATTGNFQVGHGTTVCADFRMESAINGDI